MTLTNGRRLPAASVVGRIALAATARSIDVDVAGVGLGVAHGLAPKVVEHRVQVIPNTAGGAISRTVSDR